MGFRKDAYCSVWEIIPEKDTRTKVRISTSRRIKDSDKFEQDFSGYVAFVGTATAKKAACLKKGSRIKLGDVDVTTSYNAEKKVTYTNYTVFNFEEANTTNTSAVNNEPEPAVAVDDGEVDDRLPF